MEDSDDLQKVLAEFVKGSLDDLSGLLEEMISLLDQADPKDREEFLSNLDLAFNRGMKKADEQIGQQNETD